MSPAMHDIILARALHVLGVVMWIGGVAMATTVALPAVRAAISVETWLAAFKAIERRFVWQARTAIIVVGLTGIYMTARLVDCLAAERRPLQGWHGQPGMKCKRA